MKFNFTAPLNSLGYGVASNNIFLSAMKDGHDITLWPISFDTDIIEQQNLDLYKKAIENQSFYDKNAASIRIWHQFDLGQHIGKGMHIGFPIFELDRFTEREKHHIQSQDMIFVCSDWAKRVIENQTYQKNVQIVPLGVDREIFNENITIMGSGQPLLQELIASAKNNVIFINVGKWEIRKGHDILIDAFSSAFNENDNIELWMCCQNPFLSDEESKKWENLYKNSPLADKIRILPRLTSQRDLAIIMSLSDVGVFPVRAEGWNLDALELMACGKRIIATDYSAHTEFMTKENALLIPISLLEDAVDNKWFFGQGQWAQFDIYSYNCLVELLKNEYKKGKGIINSNGIETSKKFNWGNSARKLISYLS